MTASVVELPHKAAPACTVIICTKNRPAELERCLASVSQLDYPRVDVLVVENGPRDSRTCGIAARWGARYTAEPVEGLSRARNRGVQSSAAEIVAFIDDDAVAEAGWLRALVAEFSDPKVMAVGGRVVGLS